MEFVVISRIHLPFSFFSFAYFSSSLLESVNQGVRAHDIPGYTFLQDGLCQEVERKNSSQCRITCSVSLWNLKANIIIYV